jgi:hypothetical protein
MQVRQRQRISYKKAERLTFLKLSYYFRARSLIFRHKINYLMKKLASTVVAAMCGLSAFGQHNLGIATSNWSGMNSMYLNPSLIADGRHYMVVDIANVNAGIDNSFGYLISGTGILRAINKGETFDILKFSGRGKFSLLAPYAEVRGPGFMWAINSKHSVALSTRMRGMHQFHNFDKSIYHAMMDPNATPGGSFSVSSQDFNYTAHVWSELGGTYAINLLDDKTNRLKAGVTLRYMRGVGYVGLKGDIDAQFDADNTSFTATDTRVEYVSNILTAGQALENGLTNINFVQKYFGENAGWGMGGELGITYEYADAECLKTSHSQPDYVFRIAASVLDIGRIKYKGANSLNTTVTGDGTLSGQGLADNVRSYDDFVKYAASQGFTATTDNKDVKVYMPTRLLLTADYFVAHRFYLNATYIGNLANRNNFGNSFYSQISLTPRWDKRLWSVGLPITYSMLTNTVRFGLGARVSGFFIGSDDILALTSSHQYGFNFYMGGFVPFNKDKPITHIGLMKKHEEAPVTDLDEREDKTEMGDRGEKEEKEESSEGDEKDEKKPARRPARPTRHDD